MGCTLGIGGTESTAVTSGGGAGVGVVSSGLDTGGTLTLGDAGGEVEVVSC